MLLLPYSGLGGGAPPEAPAGFVYPDKATFAQGFAKAIESIDDQWANETLEVPIAATVPFLKGVVSVAGGAEVSALARGEFKAGAPAAITGALTQALAGSLQIVQQIQAGQQVSQSLSDVADAVPVIGAIATMIIGWIMQVVVSQELRGQAAGEVERELHEQLDALCRQWASSHQVYPTLSGGAASPADFFRRVAFAYQSGGPLPLDAASMYVMLCGGETQGFGMSRARWSSLVATARTSEPKIGYGIPPPVQRTMWRLIKGIMATVQPPIQSDPLGDDGRALMPILQEIVRQYYLNVSERSGPGWNETLGRLLSQEVASQGVYGRSHSRAVGQGSVQRYSTCAGGHGYAPHVDLEPPLRDSLVQFQGAMRAQFYNEKTGRWGLAPKDRFTTAKTGAVVMSGSVLEQTSSGIDGVFGSGALMTKILKLAIAAGAGYGGYRLVTMTGYKPRWL